MNWISRLERKYGRFCIPNLISIIVGATAFSMSVQLYAQCRKPDFIHCAGNSSDVPFLHIAG